MLTSDTILVLWLEKSAISRKTFDYLLQSTPGLELVEKTFRFPLDPVPTSMAVAQGVCSVTVRWSSRTLNHHFLILPDELHAANAGGDLIVRLSGQIDTISNTLWSLNETKEKDITLEPAKIKSGQTIPEACQVSTPCHYTIPAQTKDVPIRLNILPGQTLDHNRAFFPPLRMFNDLGLSLDATHMVDVNSRFTYLLVKNDTLEEITIPNSTPPGWLINTNFHDFELHVPVIGRISPSLLSNTETNVVHTEPLCNHLVLDDERHKQNGRSGHQEVNNWLLPGASPNLSIRQCNRQLQQCHLTRKGGNYSGFCLAG